jgi:hypothetical protein
MSMNVSQKQQVSFGTNIIVPPEVRNPLTKRSNAFIDRFTEAMKSDGINTTLKIKKTPKSSYSDIIGEYQVITDGKLRTRGAFPYIFSQDKTTYEQIKQIYQDMKEAIIKVNKRNLELLNERNKH